jgi:hypothetical protein
MNVHNEPIVCAVVSLHSRYCPQAMKWLADGYIRILIEAILSSASSANTRALYLITKLETIFLPTTFVAATLTCFRGLPKTKAAKLTSSTVGMLRVVASATDDANSWSTVPIFFL